MALTIRPIGPIEQPDKIRFAKYVDKRGDDECWLWTGHVSKFGYGSFHPTVDGLVARNDIHRAHRVAYAIAFGETPANILVCHKCDVRACVNPNHLFLGTQRDNVNDMWAKGRGHLNLSPLPGILNGNAKLSEADVIAIRAVPKRKNLRLAEKYGVSKATISKIKAGETWKSVGAISAV